MLFTREELRYYGMNIIDDCPFCNSENESIDHIFLNFDFAYNDWFIIKNYCPIPINVNLGIIDWLKDI